MLSVRRGKAFFAQAISLHEDAPEKVATDGLASYPRAIEAELGQDTEHEVRPCTANPVEQSHRRIKHRYYPALGFGEFDATQRFCQAVDEVGNFLRPRSRMAEFVSLGDLRERFMKGGRGTGSSAQGCLGQIERGAIALRLMCSYWATQI